MEKTLQEKKYFDANGNIEEAKKLLAEAGYPDGKGLPIITLLYNPEGGHGNICKLFKICGKK